MDDTVQSVKLSVQDSKMFGSFTYPDIVVHTCAVSCQEFVGCIALAYSLSDLLSTSFCRGRCRADA